MLWGAFTFCGRMGRLNYAVNALLMTVTLALFAGVAFAAAFAMAGSLALVVLACLGALVALPVVLWVALALLARRIRDIGWEPRIVLPAAALLTAAERVVIGHFTFIGLGLNLTLAIILFIMPGADDPARNDQAGGVPPG